MFEDIKSIKSTKKDLRSFSLILAGMSALVGIYLYRKNAPEFFPWFIVATVFFLSSLLVPRFFLRPLHKIWMGVAIILGTIVSHAILTIVFFIVITPIGFLARWRDKDFLRLKRDRSKVTYWIKREIIAPSDHYEKQF